MAAPDRATRRRLAVRAVVRPTLTATFLLVTYYLLPLDGTFTVTTAVLLLCALVALAASFTWHARSIVRSEHPRLRAIEALVTSVSLFLLMFALAYSLMDNTTQGAFSEPLNRTDALYFTLTTFSTVGFGDIVPRSTPARVLTMVQMIGDLVIVGLAARILVEAVRRGLERQGRDAPDR
ncbi:two pore domain potassium channel family protein [Actinomadura barringtoniae]|uniref:Two pore domain potassium channel family protein n=1 Tax=Actinomadura barringtoniae TaxID=1427535 RepID=A0A939T1F5_9ACTN|nr:potassium channel family protein [Actinomadura barringtoniae]MBO2447441.1 two pore domain potassium channel family protein [Actinomadura barringtoniae]